MNYDNYIFDLYGTLVDIKTDEWAKDTWKKWCNYLDEKGIKHPYYWFFRRQFFKKDKEYRKERILNGDSDYPEIDIIKVYRELFTKYGNTELSDELLNEIAYQFRVCSREYMRLFPGVIEFLDKIKEKGKHAYILSNAQASYTLPEIKEFKLDEMVDDFIMSSDFGYMKPEPKFYEILLKRHNMDKEKTVMIGDSLSSDIKGAKLTGILAIHLVNENNPNAFYLDNIDKIHSS